MKLDDQNKAIAEFCGVKPELVEWWAYKPDDTGGRICMSAPTKEIVMDWINENPVYAKGYEPKAFYRYPNYTGDLNAMHDAAMTLSRETLEYSNYCSHLNQIVAISNSRASASPIQSCDASAPQRAEAFLRSLDLWKEDA